VIKEIAAIAGGKGGGRPNMAMAGVPDLSKIDEALGSLPALIEKLVH
jgi:alanyl-tRNA synthetase